MIPKRGDIPPVHSVDADVASVGLLEQPVISAMADETWDVAETRRLVSRLYGPGQLALVAPCMRSVDDRLRYAKIHYLDAIDDLKKYTESCLKDASLLEVSFGADEDSEPWIEFNLAIRRIAAHLIACFQSVHSLADTLAHAVYFALALNLEPNALRPRQVGATAVRHRIAKGGDALAVGEALRDLTEGGEFAYLEALVNHTKHRSIVFPSLSEDLTGARAERHLIKMEGFEYEGASYPPVVVTTFIIEEYERCSRAVVRAGCAMNATLSLRLGDQPPQEAPVG